MANENLIDGRIAAAWHGTAFAKAFARGTIMIKLLTERLLCYACTCSTHSRPMRCQAISSTISDYYNTTKLVAVSIPTDVTTAYKLRSLGSSALSSAVIEAFGAHQFVYFPAMVRKRERSPSTPYLSFMAAIVLPPSILASKSCALPSHPYSRSSERVTPQSWRKTVSWTRDCPSWPRCSVAESESRSG